MADGWPDGQWIRDAQARFERPLLAYATRLMGDVERGRDIVQDAFARLCDLPVSESIPKLPQWLFAVCRNRAIDLKRKEKRVTQVEELPDVIASDSSPPEKLSQKEDANQVIRLIDSLPENQREVIRLKFQSGLSYPQIAEITGHSVSNVGFLIHTGLKTIRAKMTA